MPADDPDARPVGGTFARAARTAWRLLAPAVWGLAVVGAGLLCFPEPGGRGQWGRITSKGRPELTVPICVTTIETGGPNRSLPARFADRALHVWVGGPIREGLAVGRLWILNPAGIDAAVQRASAPVRYPVPFEEVTSQKPLHRQTAVAAVKLPVLFGGLLALCGLGWGLRTALPARGEPGRVRRFAAAVGRSGRPWAVWFAGLGAVLIAPLTHVETDHHRAGIGVEPGGRRGVGVRGLSAGYSYLSVPWNAPRPDAPGATPKRREWELGGQNYGLELGGETFRRVAPGGRVLYRYRSLYAYVGLPWLLLPPALVNLVGRVRRRRAARAAR